MEERRVEPRRLAAPRTADAPNVCVTARARHVLQAYGVPLAAVPVEGENCVGVQQAFAGLRAHRLQLRDAGLALEADAVAAEAGVVPSASRARLPPPLPHQTPAIDAFRGADGAARSGVLHAPPGFGKTFTALRICARTEGPILVLVPTAIARDQWKAVLGAAGVSVFVLGVDKTDEWRVRGAVLATYWVLTCARGNLTAPLNDAVTRVLAACYSWLVLDEVHRVDAPVFSQACTRVLRRHTLGMTATLSGEATVTSLTSLVGPVRFAIDYAALASYGVAPSVVEAAYGVDLHPAFAAADADGYDRRLLHALNPRKVAVLLALLEKHAGDKVIVFCDWRHALAPLCEVVRTRGHALFGPLHGDSAEAERRDALQGLAAADGAGVLVVSRVGEMALDVPELSVCVQMTSTRSLDSSVQRRGRITRHVPGKVSSNYVLVTRGAKEAAVAAEAAPGGVVPFPGAAADLSDGEARALLEACVRRKRKNAPGDAADRRGHAARVKLHRQLRAPARGGAPPAAE